MVHTSARGAGTFGQLEFVDGTNRRVLNTHATQWADARQAKFCRIRVQPMVSGKRLEELTPGAGENRVDILRGLVDYIKYDWKVDMPSVVFDVTGSASDVDLRPAFLQMFKNSLLRATRGAHAWVVTGGTDCGIMKLVGDSLSTVQSSAVTMGIGTWGTTWGRSRLDNDRAAEKVFMKTCGTVRVAFGQADAVRLRAHKVDLREQLHQVFSKYGRVIGINHVRAAPSSERHTKAQVEIVTPLAPEKEGWANWHYVTFDKRASATRAKELRRANLAGQSVVVHVVPVAEDGVHERTTLADGAANAAHALLDVPQSLRDTPDALRDAPRALRNTPIALREVKHKGVAWLFDSSDEDHLAVERKGFKMHMEALISSRGRSSALPYMYDGKRDWYRETKMGSSLNPNHSHYILVDDNTTAKFGREIAFRTDLLEFVSYRRDTETCSTKELRKRIIAKDGSRVSPVITFVFGGGKGTLQTVLHSMGVGRPIIVCQGSGRCADLIVDWKNLHSDMTDMVRSKIGSPELARAAMCERQNSLARAWLGDPQNNYNERIDLTKAHLQGRRGDQPTTCDHLDEEIACLRGQLDTIIAYTELHIFNTESSSHELLPVVWGALFDSPTVTNSVKLPLAIRYNSTSYVEKILRRGGTKRLAAREEMSTDSRLLTFAAFHDNADVFQRLIDWGFDVEQIDDLILLELHQLAQLRVLENTKEYAPPVSWINAYRRSRGTEHQNAGGRETWESLSTEEQLSAAKSEWDQLSAKKQHQIVRDDICRVGWDKMPCMSGWTYRAVHFLGRTTNDYGNAARRYLGQGFTLLRVRRHVGAAMTAELCAPSGEILEGVFLTAVEAQQCLIDFVGEAEAGVGSNSRWKEVFVLGSSRWIALYDPAVPMREQDWGKRSNVLLQQDMFDTVVGGLDINENGRLTPSGHSKQREMSALLKDNAFAAFGEWIDFDNVNIGVPWWEMDPPSEPRLIEMDRCVYEMPLDALHRVFWAVITNRDHVAEILWKLLPAQGSFSGAFLASYAIRHSHIHSEDTARKNAEIWNHRTVRFLDELHSLADPECGRAIFDQYLYFGLEEEAFSKDHAELPTHFSALSDAEKRNNARRRAAMRLMGCDIETPKTRVDLALAADCQEFLGHIATEQFMDYLWAAPSFDSFSEKMLRGTFLSVLTVPRVKFASALLCWVIFASIFAVVYSSLEPPTRMRGLLYPGRNFIVPKGTNAEVPANCTHGCAPYLEVVFWGWVSCLLVNEMYQMVNDFESLRDYLSASGNAYDAVMQLIFFVAFILRVVSWSLWQDEHDLSSDELHRCTDNYPACELYMCCLGLLSVNTVAVGVRILYNLNIFKDIGILLIIVKDIVTKDVVPFFAVLMIFLGCFEIGGIFFFLASDQNYGMYDAGSYVLTWIDVGNWLDLPTTLGHERWLNTDFQNEYSFVSSAHFVYTVVFFVITGIILTNLLIAMMSSTFDNVQAAATQIWRATFSGQVREYCDATILPLPFNIPELALNMCMKERFVAESHLMQNEADENFNAGGLWGRHYTWPLPTSRFDLHFEMNRRKITSAEKSPELLQLEAIRNGQLQADINRRRTDDHHQQLRRADSDLRLRGIAVRIVEKAGIHIDSMKLAHELGVHKVWRPGKEYSDTSAGYPIHVDKLPPSWEDEDTLTDMFSHYGGVLAATVRKRSGYDDDGQKILSWALLSFTSRRAASNAVSATNVPPGLEELVVTELDEDRAISSTGAMSTVYCQHLSKTVARASIGTIVSQTAGASAIVGERCCAVRLYADERVLLVRRSSLEELSRTDVETIWQNKTVEADGRDDSTLGPKGRVLEEFQGESASMARIGLLRAASIAVLSTTAMKRSSTRSSQSTVLDAVNQVTSKITRAQTSAPASASNATAHRATDESLATAAAGVEDEFTDLLFEAPSDPVRRSSDAHCEQNPETELPGSQSELTDDGQEEGPSWPSLKDGAEPAPSLDPTRPTSRRAVHTPATSTHANAQVAALAANALRDHEGDPHVQRAANRLNALLSTMDALATETDIQPTRR